jgi:hypothetical protein
MGEMTARVVTIVQVTREVLLPHKKARNKTEAGKNKKSYWATQEEDEEKGYQYV